MSSSSQPTSSSTSNPSWSKNVVCRYFSAGRCLAGNGCAYSHDRTLSNRGTIPCKFFQNGTCAMGDQCRFSHGQPKGATSQTEAAAAEAAGKVIYEASSGTSGRSTFTWVVNATEFIPRSVVSAESHDYEATTSDDGAAERYRSWAQVVDDNASSLSVEDAESCLCPFYMSGECRYGQMCSGIHGDKCELCHKCVLHPFHEQQRKEHHRNCLKHHEAQMELAFAVARSKDKVCGICMDVVIKKPKGEARFGILPNCSHCFCLSCLRKWRQAKQFEQKVIRSCPECRQKSDYICPSQFWVETKEEKDKLLEEYKLAMNKKECKYFKTNNGKCPFGNKCFYGHIGADGKPVDLGPPQKRHLLTHSSEEPSFVRSFLLYDFLEERDDGFVLPFDFIHLFEFLSDSDDSSDY